MQAHHEVVLQQVSAAFQEQLTQALVRATQTANAAAACFDSSRSPRPPRRHGRVA